MLLRITERLVSGFHKTLLKGKRNKWFDENTNSSFSPKLSGIFCEYRQIKPQHLFKTIKTAMDQVKSQYFTAGNHSRYVTGKFDDSNKPIFYNIAARYFGEMNNAVDITKPADEARKKKSNKPSLSHKPVLVILKPFKLLPITRLIKILLKQQMFQYILIHLFQPVALILFPVSLKSILT